MINPGSQLKNEYGFYYKWNVKTLLKTKEIGRLSGYYFNRLTYALVLHYSANMKNSLQVRTRGTRLKFALRAHLQNLLKFALVGRTTRTRFISIYILKYIYYTNNNYIYIFTNVI